MIAFVKIHTALTGSTLFDKERIQGLKDLNELLNQGYEVKMHSTWAEKEPVTLMLHKHGPMDLEGTKCVHCGGYHLGDLVCPFQAETITP